MAARTTRRRHCRGLGGRGHSRRHLTRWAAAPRCGGFAWGVGDGFAFGYILQDGWAWRGTKTDARGPLCFSLAFRASGIAAKLVAAWANLRTDLLCLPYGDQGLLLRRKDYDAAGGYLDQPLMEDVALVRALAPRVSRIRAHAFTGRKNINSRVGCAVGPKT